MTETERLNNNLEQLNKNLDSFKTFVDGTYVRKDHFDAVVENIKEDLKAHDSWLTWGLRLIIGLIAAPVVGAAIAYAATRGL